MKLTGIVTNQAIEICVAKPQRIMLTRSADPAPTILELITCVVLTGPPNKAAPNITTELEI